MMRFTRLVALLTLSALSPLTAAKEIGLDRWIDDELVPFLGEQLTEHPRFKGETFMFVILDGNAPTARSNGLALSLRDRLLDAALHFGGVRIGWVQGSANRLDNGPVDCSRDDVHYYIGLQLSRHIDGSYEVKVRARDVEDRTWVSGFAKSWRGRLNRTQQQAMQRVEVDETFLGAREVPFTLTQTDLLAQRLAHDLSCNLMRQTNGEYVVPETALQSDGDELDAAAELIRNYIAAHSAFEVTAIDDQANADLAGKAYQIDGSLYQYWLSVTPNGNDADLTTLSASAYIVLPDTRHASNRSPANAPRETPNAARAIRPDVLSMPGSGSKALIGPLSVVDPAYASQCGPGSAMLRTTSYRSSRRQCSLLEADAYASAVVFILEYQAQLGLVRLGDDSCRHRTKASVVRRGESLRFPIAWFRADTGEVRETDDWQVVPTLDTYYAIAVTDEGSARRLANHIDRLPIRCGDASRPGLLHSELRNWLGELVSLAAQSADHIDWRALELRNVF